MAEVKYAYSEIVQLHDYCVRNGIDAVLENFFDGYAIRFKNGGDIVQHRYSYQSGCGCVEPAIGCKLDYRPVTLKAAKALVKRHKERLNSVAEMKRGDDA